MAEAAAAYKHAAAALARAFGPLDEVVGEERWHAALQISRVQVERGLAAAEAGDWKAVEESINTVEQLLDANLAEASPTTIRRSHAIRAQVASLLGRMDEARGRTLHALKTYERALETLRVCPESSWWIT